MDVASDEGIDAVTLDQSMEDRGVPTDSMPPDGSPIDVPTSDSGVDPCPLTRVIVTTSDGTEGAYVTGTVADRMFTYRPPPMGSIVEQDHVVRRAGCRVYDLWRSFGAGPNQLVEIDPANPYSARRTITIPPVPMVGAPNPYDVVEVSPTKSYLVLYNAAYLFVFNPQTGAMTSTIDLAPFADSDGIPEASMIHVANGRAWIALQQLNRAMGYAAPARSTVVAIDTSTDQPADLDPMTAGVQATVSLNYGNPQFSTTAQNGRLWLIASTGTFGNGMDGGIDVLDTQTGRVGATFSAAMLGSDPGSLTMVTPRTAWIVTRPREDGGARTRIRVVDLMTMTVSSTSPLERPEPLSELQLGPDGHVWALNGSFGANGAVYVFRPDGSSLSTFALPMRGDAGATGTYSMTFAP
jgi:sugar lactone lactonase YvrE